MSFVNYTPFRTTEPTSQGRRTLAPGKKGTKKLLRQYGSRLVCLRYRYNAERRLRFTSVELIVRTSPLVTVVYED